ncbi:hypothetical protein LTR08_002256 [Meristemomyces frigidus]|nr:hypothetical protein LTR08_002256 [Meristemomyces frigidus]
MSGTEALITAIVCTFAHRINSTYISLLPDSAWPSKQAKGPLSLLFPTGTFAAGVWQVGDDIRLVYMSKDRLQLVWEIVREALDMAETLKPPANRMMELPLRKLGLDARTVHGSKIYLHHCRPPSALDLAMLAGYGMPPYEGDETTYSRQEEAHLAMVRDAVTVKTAPPKDLKCQNGDLRTFSQVYQRIRRWADGHQLMGAPFGLLEEECLLWMVYLAYRGSAPTPQTWRDNFHGSYAGARSRVRPTRMRVRTMSGRDLGKYITPEGVSALVEALEGEPADTNADDCYDAPRAAYPGFLRRFPFFIEVNMEIFKTGPQSVRDVVEVQLPALIKSLGGLLGSPPARYLARIWPEPVSSSVRHQTYLMGLDFRELDRELASRSKLISALKDAQHNMRFDYDRSTAIITMGLRNRRDVSVSYPPSSSAAGTPGVESHTVPTIKTVPETPRFRTGASAIARLKHDVRHASLEYEIRYLDRFEGLMWMALESWGGKATEEEDFIPEHRVRQIRRVEDGVLVWDRRGRLDLLG